MCDVRKPTGNDQDLYFNRNLNTFVIWLPLEKRMRWKQGIKRNTRAHTHRKHIAAESCMYVHALSTRASAAWATKRSINTTKDKVCFVCVFTGKRMKKKGDMLLTRHYALVCTFLSIQTLFHLGGAAMPLMCTCNCVDTHQKCSRSHMLAGIFIHLLDGWKISKEAKRVRIKKTSAISFERNEKVENK